MPITSSAKKALRQSRRRRSANTARQSAFKSAIKGFRRAITDKKLETAAAELRKAMQALDKAVKTNAVKKNKANRLKSRLAKALKKVS